MFSHILFPTDGSPLSEAAMRDAFQFAKIMKARVTGFCVLPEVRHFSFDSEVGPEFKKQAAAAVQAEVKKIMLEIEKAAKEAGVPCETAMEKSDQPYEAIVRAAQKRECDLIIMASHGRRGVEGLLLGSETQKVLTHTKNPVLVYR
jgi:nucleotide-binding universal stress UspA family protein